MTDLGEVPTATQEVADKSQFSHLRSFIAGGVGGVALVAVGHPPDTIKARPQSLPSGQQRRCPFFPFKADVDLSFYRSVFSCRSISLASLQNILV